MKLLLSIITIINIALLLQHQVVTGFGVTTTSSTLQKPSPTIKTLKEYTNNVLPNIKFDMSLDIDNRHDKSNNSNNQQHQQHRSLSIQSVLLELTNKQDEKDKTSKTTTTATTTIPNFLLGNLPSGGKHVIDIQKPGQYIDFTGTVYIPWNNANWELVWRKDAPAGTLLIGLSLEDNHDDINHDVTRNEHTYLEHGNTYYISFSVWDKDNLNLYQQYKHDYQEAATTHLQERDEELRKMQQTSNWFVKALHYRNAAAAVEKYTLTPTKLINHVPDHVHCINNNNMLYISKTGTIWKKNTKTVGIHHILLGTATIHNIINNNNNDNEDDHIPIIPNKYEGLAP